MSVVWRLLTPPPRPRTPELGAEEVEAKREQMVDEAQDSIRKAKLRLSELELEVDKIKRAKPLDETTVEEMLAKNPEIAKEIDDEMDNHNWSV